RIGHRTRQRPLASRPRRNKGRAQRRCPAWTAIFSCQLGDGQEHLSKRFLRRKVRPFSRQRHGGRFLGTGGLAALALGCRRASESPSPGKSDHRCILRERLARWRKRSLWYRPALILSCVSRQDWRPEVTRLPLPPSHKQPERAAELPWLQT